MLGLLLLFIKKKKKGDSVLKVIFLIFGKIENFFFFNSSKFIGV